jgi:flagellar hook-associated protein 2
VGISSPGIGSGLDVDSLVSKLMAAESAPLNNYDTKAAAAQAKVAAYGKLSAAIGSFQGALSSLSSPDVFNALKTASGNEDVLTGSASAGAAPGKYKINVTQMAQAQSLNTPGRASTTTNIGSNGATTKISFQFGTVTGTYGLAGGALGASVANTGVAKGALSINGTTIATDGSTRSADALAAAINAQSDTTGVTATAGAATTAADLFGAAGATTFGAVDTGASGSYALTVGGVTIAAQGAGIAVGDPGSIDADSLDTTLGGTNATTQALAAAGISYAGKASLGTLRFTAADGSNIEVAEEVTGTTVKGGLHNGGTANNGSRVVASATLTLNSASGSPITVGGANPGLAGLSAGTGGSYLGGAGFDLDASRAIGSVTLGAGSQSLAGIRDAINKAAVGVTASIVSDGGTNPYHLVLTSNSTGAKSSMKIVVSGDSDGTPPDPAIAALLAYDPAGAQALTQTSAALSTKANVNGIEVTSDNTSVNGAIDGVSFDVKDLGSTTLSVAKDSKSVTDSINGFVKAYNTLNSTIASLTSYDPASKRAGDLQGDFTVRGVQSQLRAQLGKAVEGLNGLTTLSQIGVSFQKDGSLAVDSGKLSQAMTQHGDDIAGLFAAVGQASDGLVKVAGSSAKTKAGEYPLVITQMATKGSLASDDKLGAITAIGANTTWTVTLNQTDPATATKVQNVSIPAGNYGPKELASVLRSAINSQKDFAAAGDTVDATIGDDGKLTLSSTRYGSTSNLTFADVSGTGLAAVFGASKPFKGVGQDVAGTIGGVTASGSGQTLTGAVGSAVEGLKLTINGGTTGDRGSINFSQGYAFQLNTLATSFIGTDGTISGKTKGLGDSVKAIQKDRDAFSTRLTAIEARYRAQFTALDTMLQSMQTTQSYLTQQLKAIAANG